MIRGAQSGCAGEGADTRAFRVRLRATPPDALPGIDGVPALPPQVPGLAGLVPVGRGGTGIVYRAHDKSTAQTVAVKVLLVGEAISPAARARARREGEILATLDHPNIVRVLSMGELRGSPGWPDGLPYLVMEWLPGVSLQRNCGDKTLPTREAVRLIRDLARVLAEVHARGIVHRDLKPANVMLVAGEGGDGVPVAKLVDFGLASSLMATSGLTPASGVVGTPEYMAPEQAGLNDPAVRSSPATDIHGLGGILFFLLFGRAPYGANTVPEAFARVVAGEVHWPSGWKQRIALDLRTILEKCLDRGPARRYASAGELADDLDRFLDGRPIVARRKAWLERLGQGARRRPAVAVAVLLGGGFLAAAIAGLWAHRVRLEHVREAVEVAQVAFRASLEVLAGEPLERMIVRSPPLDESSVEYLRGLVRIYSEAAPGPHRRDGVLLRIKRLRDLASTFARTERIDDAVESLHAAFMACAELEAFDPAGDEVATLRFDILQEGQKMLVDADRLAAAETVIRKAIGISLGWRKPLTTERRIAVNEAQANLALVINRQGRSEEAASIVALALDDMRQTSDSNPDHVGSQMAELVALCNAAEVSKNAGRSAERSDRLRAVVRLASEAIQRHPKDREHLTKKLVYGLASLADAEADAGHFEESFATTKRLENAVRAGMEELEDTSFFRGEAIEAAIRESIATRGLDRPDATLDTLESALAMARGQVETEPAVYLHAQRLVKVRHFLGLLHEDAGRPAAAIDAYRGMITPLEPWAAAPDRKASIRAICSGAHARIGTLLRRQGDLSGAVTSYEQALIEAVPVQRPPLLVALAMTALEKGDTRVARQAAEEALLDASTTPIAHQVLARIPD